MSSFIHRMITQCWMLSLSGLLAVMSCGSSVPVATDSDGRYASASLFQLASPILESQETFFEKPLQVSLKSPQQDADLYYTLDGSIPTTSSSRYTAPIEIRQTSVLKVRAFHAAYQPSAVLSKAFKKLPPAIKVKAVKVTPQAHVKYAGKGAPVLVDRKKGSANFRTDAWLGFNGKEVQVDLEFLEVLDLKRISVSLLSDQASWIFLPTSIAVLASEDGVQYRDVSNHFVAETSEGSSSEMIFVDLPLDNLRSQYLRLIINGAQNIPAWHSGAGTPAWLFMDEILIESK